MLVFTEILVYGRREDIKTNPPSVIIEIYDQDKVILYILEVRILRKYYRIIIIPIPLYISSISCMKSIISFSQYTYMYHSELNSGKIYAVKDQSI